MKTKKVGHLAPKGYKINLFNHVEISGDFGYCKSHNFVYNTEEEKRKLYNGQPCYYTDIRFLDGANFYKSCYLRQSRWKDFSLKTAIRIAKKCRNIPVGTIVEFAKSWYIPGKNVRLSYNFKVRKENQFDVQYEVNDPGYFDTFKTCQFSKDLTDALRKNGFIVRVQSDNPNRLSSLFSTTAAYAGKFIEVKNEDGESAIAYGHGKKIGFSSGRNTLFGYSNGIDNILYDHFGEFDKWSRCLQISKDTPIEEIVRILIEDKPTE